VHFRRPKGWGLCVLLRTFHGFEHLNDGDALGEGDARVPDVEEEHRPRHARAVPNLNPNINRKTDNKKKQMKEA